MDRKRQKELARRKKLDRERDRAAERKRRPAPPAPFPAALDGLAELIASGHRRKQARKKAAAERERKLYPEFVFVENDAPTEFVEMVRRACAAIDFTDQTQFFEWEAAVYRELRAGWPWPVFSGEHAWKRNSCLAINLGEQVLRRIPAADLARFAPYSDVRFMPRGRDVCAYFRSLCREKGDGGTVYYSRHRPTVEVGGRQLVVGFSTHAVEKTLGRSTIESLSYPGLGDVFALLDQCQEFEVVTLPDGRLGFSIWDICPAGFAVAAVAEAVLGGAYDPAAPYMVRVGYCPAVVEGGFLKAKTLLYPGWRGTPERDLLRAARLPREQRRAWLDLLGGMGAARFCFEAPPLLKWFHDQGVPQVRPGEPRFAPAFDAETLSLAYGRTLPVGKIRRP